MWVVVMIAFCLLAISRPLFRGVSPIKHAFKLLPAGLDTRTCSSCVARVMEAYFYKSRGTRAVITEFI